MGIAHKQQYLSEKALLEAMNAGVADAFEQLVRTHANRLFKMAFNRLNHREDAEDMVQDLLVGLWESRGDLRIESNLTAYLNISLRNRVFNHIKRATLHQQAIQKMVARIATMQESVLEVLMRKDMHAMLSEAVAELPLNMQNIFILRGEDYSLKEIAIALGLAEQTVKSYSAELVRRLRTIIAVKYPEVDQLFVLALVYMITEN